MGSINAWIALPALVLNALVFVHLKRANRLLSPYTFFCILVSIQFSGPLLYS